MIQLYMIDISCILNITFDFFDILIIYYKKFISNLLFDKLIFCLQNCIFIFNVTVKVIKLIVSFICNMTINIIR